MSVIVKRLTPEMMYCGLCNREHYHSTHCSIDDMKRNILKFSKSKYSSLTINDSLGSISEPATSTSTADPVLSVSNSTSAAAALARAQVTQVAGVTVSSHLR
jgi:hypothetical protein